MIRKGLVSKHIVLTAHEGASLRYPVAGIIFVVNEVIEKVEILESNYVFGDLIFQYSDWELEDYTDYYISPGIIDLNVRREFEDFSQLTKTAIQGGVTVTVVEAGYYTDYSTSKIYYCDIINILVANDTTDFASIDPNTLAIKCYLYPPCLRISSTNHLSRILVQVKNLSVPLFVSSDLPETKTIDITSPLRMEPAEARKDKEIKIFSSFAASFQSNAESSEDSISGQSDSEELTHIKSFYMKPEESQILDSNSCSSSDEETKVDSDIVKNFYNIPEVKECDESSPKRLEPDTKKNYYYIDNNLDNKIKALRENLEDLCDAEKSTYSASGSTIFGLDRTKTYSLSFFNCSDTESESTETRSFSKSPKTPRKGFRPNPIEIKKNPFSNGIKDYKLHLANYPESWENSGVDKVISSLQMNSKVHFQNLSSVSAINKIRNIKKKYKNVTCEIPAVHLYFNSKSIKYGDTRFKNNPPIRNEENFNLLWDLLKKRGIDLISSQHAHIEFQDKVTGDFKRALNGISCIGCSLQSTWTMLKSHIGQDPKKLEHYIVKLAKWLSVRPAQVLNISSKKGSIEKEKFADMIIWKPNEPYIIDETYAYTETSPFFKEKLLGCVHKVYLKGKLAYDRNFYPVGSELRKKDFNNN